MKKAFALHD